MLYKHVVLHKFSSRFLICHFYLKELKRYLNKKLIQGEGDSKKY